MQKSKEEGFGLKRLTEHLVAFLHAFVRRTIFDTADASVRLVRLLVVVLVALLFLPTLLMLISLLLACAFSELFSVSLLSGGALTALLYVVVLVLLYRFRKPLMAPLCDKILSYFMDLDERTQRGVQHISDALSSSSMSENDDFQEKGNYE